MQVSIIIPVYNAEKFLTKCLESIERQGLSSYEILCIDDGSTDKSKGIIQELGKTNPRIKYIHQKNQGASIARNKGIDAAIGEFLFFCDADDTLQKGALREMYDLAIEKEADLVIGNYQEVDEEGNVLRTNNKTAYYPFKHGDTFNLESHPQIMHGKPALWMKLIAKKTIRDNSIYWEKLEIAQDLSFYTQLLPHMETCFYYDGIVYHYVSHDEAMTKKVSTKFLDIRNSLLSIRDHYEVIGLDKHYHEELDYLFFIHTAFQMTQSLKLDNPKPHYLTLKHFLDQEIGDIRKNKYFKKSIGFRVFSLLVSHENIFLNPLVKRVVKMFFHTKKHTAIRKLLD